MEASACSSTLNGNAGVEFHRAWINCDYESTAASDDEVLCMSKWQGNKSTVSEVILVLMIFMQHLKHK